MPLTYSEFFAISCSYRHYRMCFYHGKRIKDTSRNIAVIVLPNYPEAIHRCNDEFTIWS